MKLTKRNLGIFCCVVLSTVILVLVIYIFKLKETNEPKEYFGGNVYLANYDPTFLEDSPENDLIKYGYSLFKNTANHLGPNNLEGRRAYSGNSLSCNNCHLDGGTKPYSAPLIGIVQRFPQFRGRENKVGTLRERINGCFERSMNGEMLPENGKEMDAYIAYLTWLSRFAPEDGKIDHQGFLELQIPNRAVNLERGQQIFEKTCVACHQKDGSGLKFADSTAYLYPPIWGDDSYN
ncbi:MAG: c-type cytochrome, partial [Flavobacteriaceae bacterium]|nr:c-type cytochrome [Flavobacteriaceae bacterium]